MSLRDDLAHIPWQRLNHAYGSAEDTPENLLALLSTDEDTRGKALHALWASICHQGSVYEASCAAVPFLIQILEQAPVEQKPSILYLLAGLAHRGWYANQNQSILRVDHSMSAEETRNQHQAWHIGEFLQKGNEYHEPEWMHLAHTAVGEGMPIYLNLLHTRDSETQLAILYLISCYKELGDSIVPTVEEIFTQPVDYLLRSAILLCLSTLLDASSPFWQQYNTAVSSVEEHTLVRFTAAYTLARYHQQEVTQPVVDILVYTAVRPQLLDEQYQLLPWCDDSVHIVACETLARLGDPVGLQGLVRVLEQGQAHWRIFDTIRVAETLLDVAFFDDKVHGRYWSRTEKRSDKKFSPQKMFERMLKNDDPYEKRSYYNYGTSYQDHDRLEIDCYGYDQQAASQLRLRFAQEGSQWLSYQQRRALEAILQCAPLWQVKNDLLAIYGLPDTKEQLAQLLQR